MADLSATGFTRWLEGASPGDRIVYFTGHLADSRDKYPDAFLASAANSAWHAARKGLVTLLQRRCADGFEYIAVRGAFGKVEAHVDPKKRYSPSPYLSKALLHARSQ